ncbi:heme exporter protein CcmD [uncultured Erythrobacter sp.]|nr:heme exporter protein CcmD [uncultured Erythrobacter sp.]
MREALDHWDFVLAAYAIGLVGLGALVLWSWRSMRSAEQRRDEVKRR